MNTVKDLLLALLNATLILVALCLFLLWQVSRSGERIAESFASGLSVLAPIEKSVDGLRVDVTGLRNDITALTEDSTTLSDAATARLEAAAARLDLALSEIESSVETLAATPETLADYAIDQAATRIASEAQILMQCRKPDA